VRGVEFFVWFTVFSSVVPRVGLEFCYAFVECVYAGHPCG